MHIENPEAVGKPDQSPIIVPDSPQEAAAILAAVNNNRIRSGLPPQCPDCYEPIDAHKQGCRALGRVAAIKARLAAATPGPWEAKQIRDEDPNPLHHSVAEGCWYVEAPGDVNVCDIQEGRDEEADADLIANAPTDLAELIAHFEAMLGLDAVKLYRVLQRLANAADDCRIALNRPSGHHVTEDGLWPDEIEGLESLFAALPTAMEALAVFKAHEAPAPAMSEPIGEVS